MLEFIKDFKSVVIGTIDSEGLAFSSYAPFVYENNKFYIFISDIAKHSANIKREEKASLLFIEDESKAQQIFARKRISLQASSSLVKREEKEFVEVIEKFKEKFSQGMMNMLLEMSDFNLYTLKVDNGEATYGFGEAYAIGGENMEELVSRQGGSEHK